MEGPVEIFYVSRLKCEVGSTIGQVLYKWFTGVRSEGKPVTGPMMIEEAKSFYDEMKITDKCTLSEGSNKEKLCVGT
jgi:hypothetical protein